jgi:hypothetical protein
MWQYRVATFKNTEVHTIETDLSKYGRAGWELVSLSTTVKKPVNLGNDLIAVFKRPGNGEVDRSADPALDQRGAEGWI